MQIGATKGEEAGEASAARGQRLRSTEPVGRVIALGADAAVAAKRYAEATGRKFAIVANFADLAGPIASTVFVTTPEFLTRAVLDTLYLPAQGETVPGILCAPVDQLDELLAARMAHKPRGVGDAFFDATAEHAQAMPAGIFSHYHRSITIRAHSDGIACGLGSDRFLCRVADLPDIAGRPEHAPACAVAGRCTRLDSTPISVAVGDGALVSPSRVQCDVLVWRACFGWIDPNDLFDLKWGLGLALATSRSIGALLVAPGLLMEPARDDVADDVFAAELTEGRTLGAAVAAINRSPQMRRFDQYMVLFGDPEMVLGPEEQRHIAAKPAATSAGSEGKTIASAGNCDDVILVLALAERNRPSIKHETGLRSALAFYRLLQELCPDDEQIRMPKDALSADRMRRAMIDVVLSSGRIGVELIQLSSTKGSTPVTCPICGTRAISYSSEFDDLPAPPRRATVCAQHHLVRDGPLDCDLRLVLRDGRLHLDGTCEDLPSVGRLLVWAGKTWFGRAFDWPDDRGRCARSARLDFSGLTGVHFCHLAIVIGARLVVLSCRLALNGGPTPISVAQS